MRAVAPVALLALALAVVGPAAAAADPGEVTNDVSDEVMSPFCPGLTLHDCPSSAAEALRERIEDWAGRGMTKAEILQRLEAEYGPAIRATPSGEGAGLLAWILPLLAVVAGAVVAYAAARRWLGARPSPEAEQATPGISDEDRNRLEAELAALRGQR